MATKRKQVRLPPQITIDMWERQNGKCFYCNQTMVLRDKWLQPTIEHIVPRSEGGIDHPSNYCFACVKCNQFRGTIPVEQFLDGYRHWSEYNSEEKTTTTIAKKVRGPKRWYHGNFIKW